MKFLKIFVISSILIFILYLAYFKNKESIIDGHWFAKEIIFDGKQIFPTSMNEYFKINSEVNIDSWKDSISINIPIGNKNISASYLLVKNNSNNYEIHLKSKEKALNGTFKLELDTIKLQTNFYLIDMKMKFKNSLIHLERMIDTTPPKPVIPQKGKP